MVDADVADVFLGIDVGKSFHHAVALSHSGKVLLDAHLPNDEAEIAGVLATLQRKGSVLVIVDQPSDIGAFPLAVAQALGASVAYLPGVAMRRLADLHRGSAKTDRRDALVIAEAARTLPHALRSTRDEGVSITELRLLCSFDDDLVGQINRSSNRLRALLARIHPHLERVVGPRRSSMIQRRASTSTERSPKGSTQRRRSRHSPGGGSTCFMRCCETGNRTGSSQASQRSPRGCHRSGESTARSDVRPCLMLSSWQAGTTGSWSTFARRGRSSAGPRTYRETSMTFATAFGKPRASQASRSRPRSSEIASLQR